MKSVSVFLFLISFYSLGAGVQLQWLGTSGFLIKYKNSQILIDPVISRPSYKSLFGLFKMDVDKKKIDQYLKKYNVEKVDAFIVSHTHFDHAVDIGYFSSLFPKAQVIGSLSAKSLIEAYQPRFKNFREVQVSTEVMVGDFKITGFSSSHRLFAGFEFASGTIKTPFKKGNIFDFKMGGIYNFLVEAGPYKILFYGSSGKMPNKFRELDIDLLLLNILSVSAKSLDESSLQGLKFKKVIPMHWDNFFFQRNFKTPSLIPFGPSPLTYLSKLTGIDKKNYIIPEYFKFFSIQE